MTTLFDSLPLGSLNLKNRIIMAPLTRSRAGDDRIPNALMAEYYAQRSGAGLILSEATSVTPMGVGYAGTPGIWNDDQTAGWKLVTEAVHDAGGLIMLQLWHVGRISHPMFLDGETPVSASAVRPAGTVSLVRPKTEFVTPRAVETDEIPGIISSFAEGARNARRAGFDGVEIHAANGYLIDQFLQDRSNQRTDAYGGVIKNRVRLLNEITDAVIGIWGAERVGVHLSPRGDDHDMGDTDPRALFTQIATEMSDRNIAFLAIREHIGNDSLLADIKRAFKGVVIANEGLTQDSASQLLRDGTADAAAFGRDFISTPDLPERFRKGIALNSLDPARLYVGGEKGYTDYPFAADADQI